MTKKEYRLSDQVIGQLRELLQLSMLTGTSFVDHCRALRIEESEKTEGVLILSEGYVTGWNALAQKLYQQAQKKAEQMATRLADEQSNEIVESNGPQEGGSGDRQRVQN